jgi:hypothetical protein
MSGYRRPVIRCLCTVAAGLKPGRFEYCVDTTAQSFLTTIWRMAAATREWMVEMTVIQSAWRMAWVTISSRSWTRLHIVLA